MGANRSTRVLRCALFAVAPFVFADPLSAIVTRHDRDDQAYRDLGQSHPQAVSILPDGAGVLVAPGWVLTAAHVARGVANRSPRVESSGREIGVERIFLHPKWKDMGPHDIALMKLSESFDDVTPADLYTGNDEVGKVVTFVGRGDYGTGLTGPQKMDRVKRGATNRIDDADDDWIFFTFDRGDAATDLEGVSGPGDSGGPALLTVDGIVYTLGVSVFADGEGGPGRYGVREGYTRVSTHRDWIEGVLSGESADQGFVPGTSGSTSLPDNLAGRLVADYLEAYNSDDDATMRRFIAGNFSETLLETRSEADHLALYRRLYDELFGALEISHIREETDEAISVLFHGARGSMAEIRFELQGGPPPKIAGMRIAQVEVSTEGR